MAIATASGISFALTDEQKALRELVHEFAEKEIRPRAAGYDEHSTHPADVIAKAHELGLVNAHVPAEYGGLELSGFDGMLIGSKMFITNAGHAAWLVVFASTDKSKRHRGLSASVVPADLDGFVVERHLDKLGQRATDTSAIAFQDVRVPAENRLGEEGEGFKIAMKTLDFTRPGTAAGAVGVAQAACEYAVRYEKERDKFGQPIAVYQGVNFIIADMATEIEAA